MKRLVIVTALAVAAAFAVAENPHDGYVFWLPAGELKVGDAQSEKEFKYVRTDQGATFVVRPRRTRFDVPRGQLVIVDPASTKPASASAGGATLSWARVNPLPMLPATGDASLTVTLEAAMPKGRRLLVFYTDDGDKLGDNLMKPATAVGRRYMAAQSLFWGGKTAQARKGFVSLVSQAPNADAARLCRRMVRWCDAEAAFGKAKTGPAFYNLGLYAMVNGYWQLAERSFGKATALMPKNPDAWYMLADAKSYAHSDLDTKMAAIAPYYRKAADLYPHKGANTFRTYFGFFKNLRISDGKGGTTVLHMTDEQMAHARQAWSWVSAIMESASRGRLRMVNTFKVYDQEFDSTNDWNAKPFEGLFKAGTVDTFAKMTGWGASDCCGMDCGPDRSAFINLGIREWDVMLHEWNHSLDWAMISGGLGIGVPETHSSDWCGLQPISSMGMGHHSCNRSYMTPGMYQYVRGSDPITTPYVDAWKISSKPTQLLPALTEEQIKDSKVMDPFINKARALTAAVAAPKVDTLKTPAKIENGRVDLLASWPNAPKNAYAFAKTYIYSPKTQKVRVWMGMDDNLKLWLNGQPAYIGNYWACALFTEKKERDMVAGALMLQKGWNSLVAQVANVQRAPDWLGGKPADCWGFSIRLCDSHNGKVPGLKWQADAPAGFRTPVAFPFNPKSPKTYRWSKVADDYTMLLPNLSVEQLRAITGYRTLKVTNEMLFDLSGEKLDAKVAQRVLPKADPKVVALDNQINWFFSPKENAAFIRYKRGNQWRDLVFLRPEAYESYLKLMRVTPQAKKLGIKRHADQVIGYVLAKRSDSSNGRVALVVDTYLGDKLPTDEEDLLIPSAAK